MPFALDTVQCNNNVKPITLCYKIFTIDNSVTVRVHM